MVVKRNRTQIQISTPEAYSECCGEEGHKDNQLSYKVEDDKGFLAEVVSTMIIRDSREKGLA